MMNDIIKVPYGKEAIGMNRGDTLQAALDYIEDNVKNKITLSSAAKNAGYSACHFSRIFTEETGISAMSYVTWRRLSHALYDLSRGMRVIDAAMEYGFETHAGFTKAFVKWFGFPPSLCRFRLSAGPPAKMNAGMLKNKFYGGNEMNPHIIELTPFSVVGWPSRHTLEKFKNTGDAPTFWNTINLDYGPILEKLYDAFPKSKHCEISMCYGADAETGEFTYMLGRGIDDPDDLINITPDMTRVDIAGGLYAIFSTPPAEDSYIEAARKTWNDIFLNWLPLSEFEFDETRYDFEYHDHRDHGWYFGGKLQIDVCVPIRQRGEEKRKSQLRMNTVN